MRNIKLYLRYDGTNYHGWQVQKNTDLTIQGILYEALKKICDPPSPPCGCGRTDAGVHALFYVCNFIAETNIPAEKIPYALNSYLPRDIRCMAAFDEDMDFHSVKSAVKKTYTYYIQNTPIPDPFKDPYMWHCQYPLDIEKMRDAAGAFLGEHDFYGFSSSGRSTKTTVRTIYSLKVNKDGDIVSIEISGNGFLYNMVRIIAGTLMFCGCGKIRPENMPEIIASCNREAAGITAPAKGLFLTEVCY